MKTRLLTCITLLILAPWAATAQWNYDNQNTIYSNSGNVGIGTTAPGSKLEIRGTTDNTSLFIRQDRNIGGSGDVFFLRDDRGYAGINSGTTFKVESWRGSGQQGGTLANFTTIYDGLYKSRFFINNDNGYVGMGTTSPKVSFQVDGASGLQSRLRISSPSVGCSGAYDINMGTGADDLGAGMRAYVPATAPGYDRIYLGLYTTTYSSGLQSRVERLTVADDGKVGIGTTSPDAKLAVKGDIHTQEVRVDLTGSVAPDYVFEKDYHLPSLSELDAYIKAHKHLPEVPPAKEMEEEGLKLKEMNLLLLKKVEELTLHLIAESNNNKAQQMEIEAMKKEVNDLKSKMK